MFGAESGSDRKPSFGTAFRFGRDAAPVRALDVERDSRWTNPRYEGAKAP